MADKIVKSNNIEIWAETFGDEKDPAILLLMGNSCDAMLWPEEFCKEIAERGRFVIRFDQRDTGLSTRFNFDESPYTLLDMATDALGLLDALKIEKAHIIGYSSGGVIAELLVIHHPERVLSLTLMMTSIDLKIKNDAFRGVDTSYSLLPPPKSEFIQAVLEVNAKSPKNLEEKILQLVENFFLANGTEASFDRDFFYRLFKKSMKRVENISVKNQKIGHESNHALAAFLSPPVEKEQLKNIKVPTLIIAGGADPIFPSGHEKAIKEAIPHSRLMIIEDMGHILNPQFFSEIVEAIASHTG